jgi:hypothetical protein
MLEGTGFDASGGEELSQVVLVGLPGMRGGVRSSQASTARPMASRRLPGTWPPAKAGMGSAGGMMTAISLMMCLAG